MKILTYYIQNKGLTFMGVGQGFCENIELAFIIQNIRDTPLMSIKRRGW